MKIIFLVIITILVSSFNGNAQNKEDSTSTSKNEKPKTMKTIRVGGGDQPPAPPPPPPSPLPDFGDYPAPPPPPPPSEPRSDVREFYTVVEEMPMFPDSSCLLLTDDEDKRICSNQKLMNYVYETLQYPAPARAAGITGMVVISFIVEADGQITNIKTLRDPGGKLGAEGRRIINQMKIEKGPWIPGLQRGKAVATKFNLPIRFKLN